MSQNALLTQIAEDLQKKGKTLATAESCTGGMIGMEITSLPGSSSYYLGGVISYANEVKNKVLNVPKEELENYGAVSSQVAKSMASGARKTIGADFAIATTGIAGPGGATKDKPVGLVYIGIATEDEVFAYRNVFKGNRDEVRKQATITSFELLKKHL